MRNSTGTVGFGKEVGHGKEEDRAMGLLIFIISFALYLNTAAPTLAPRDSAEWAVACVTLGVPHAPGYPLYVLAGKCVTLLAPWANPAYRLNLSSALFSSLALWTLYSFCRKLALGRFAAVMACLFLGISGSFWTHASQAEVFGLHLLLVIAGLHAAISHPALSALLLGLSLGNHHTSLFALPCAAIVFLAVKRFSLRRFALLSAIFLFAAASIQGVTFLRSHQEPIFHIAEATTPKALIRTLLRRDYGTFRLYKPPAESQKRFPTLSGTALCLKTLWDGMGSVGMGLAAAGFPFFLKSQPGMCLGLASLFLLSGPLFFTLSKPTAEPMLVETILRFESLPLIPMLIYLACGLSEALRRLRPKMGLLLGGLVLGYGLWLGKERWLSDQRKRFSAPDLCLNILTDAPRPGILFISGDTLTFSLTYAHHVEKRGRDLILATPRAEPKKAAEISEKASRLWPHETKKAGWLKRIARGGRILASFEPEENPEAFPKSEGWSASPRGLLLGMRPAEILQPKIQGAHFYRFRQAPRLAENQRIYDIEIFSLYLRGFLRNAQEALVKNGRNPAKAWLEEAIKIYPESKRARALQKEIASLDPSPKR